MPKPHWEQEPTPYSRVGADPAGIPALHGNGIITIRIGSTRLDKRNRHADATYELEVTAHSLKYRPATHKNLEGLIEALINGDDQLMESTGQCDLAQAG